VWASNRHGKVLGETNIFIADWVERPLPNRLRLRRRRPRRSKKR